MRAFVNLRHTEDARAEAFRQGLRRCGYQVIQGFPTKPTERDVFLSWNRIGYADQVARTFPGQVLVAENALWGNDFLNKRWYSIAKDFHHTAGRFPVGDHTRWDNLGCHLEDWRRDGEVVVLGQRGIGPREVACPKGWSVSGRMRGHPGRNEAVPLKQDLARCGLVRTWNSGAAVKALMWGIPVESHMPNWVAAQHNTDQGRLDMFRLLAWCTFEINEITQGEPFARLLKCES